MHGLRRIQHENRPIPLPEKTHFGLREYGDAETALAAAEGHLAGFLKTRETARPTDYRIAPFDLSRSPDVDVHGPFAYVIQAVRPW